jgi:hypothetical protein
MIDKQSKYELRIFISFTSLCDLPIISDSIEKRDPPKPDIKCDVKGIGEITFELTELIDRGFANMVGKQIDTKTELDNYYNGLNASEKEDFFTKYSDAIIFVHFENSLSLQQRKNLFPSIFRHLLSLNIGFEGNTLHNNQGFKGKLKWITVSRGVNGPIFDDVPVSTIGDPSVPAIKAKFLKQYSTNHPLHLLAFIDLNPMFPDHIWLPNVMEYTESNIQQSQFDKVWIFDFQKKEIKYRYPKTKLS